MQTVADYSFQDVFDRARYERHYFRVFFAIDKGLSSSSATRCNILRSRDDFDRVYVPIFSMSAVDTKQGFVSSDSRRSSKFNSELFPEETASSDIILKHRMV